MRNSYEAFVSIINAEGSIFLGFDLLNLVAKITHVTDSAESSIVVHPVWD
jgi:hypothetical protein